ncbi:MAG: hypothetical protein K2F59_03675 [Eubacteriales bacterium]|nr:hypothetical protein [Eubacteriales bacterium]
MEELVDKIITLFDLTDDEYTHKYIYRTLEQTCENHNINIHFLKKEFEYLASMYTPKELGHINSINIPKELEYFGYIPKNLLVVNIISAFGMLADIGIKDLPAVNKLTEILNIFKT